MCPAAIIFPAEFKVFDEETLRHNIIPRRFLVKSADKTESTMYFIARGYLQDNFPYVKTIKIAFNIIIKYSKYKKIIK